MDSPTRQSHPQLLFSVSMLPLFSSIVFSGASTATLYFDFFARSIWLNFCFYQELTKYNKTVGASEQILDEKEDIINILHVDANDMIFNLKN